MIGKWAFVSIGWPTAVVNCSQLLSKETLRAFYDNHIVTRNEFSGPSFCKNRNIAR